MDMESALGGVGSRREGVAGWEGERECLCRVCRVQEECGEGWGSERIWRGS